MKLARSLLVPIGLWIVSGLLCAQGPFAASPIVAFEEMLPEDTMFYLSVPDAAELVAKFKGTNAYKIVEVLDPVALIGLEPKFQQIKEFYLAMIHPLTEVFRGRIGLAMEDLPPGQDVPRVTLLADVTAKQEQLRQHLAERVHPFLTRAGAEISSFRHGACEVQQISFTHPGGSGGLTVCYAIAEDVFVATVGREAIERKLDLMARRRVPVIYCTDLFHPPDDPDDWFDLATAVAMEELDLLGIVLDQGEKQLKKPGRIPIEQMASIAGRDVPFASGLATALASPSDKGLDQPEQFQEGVNLILRALRNSDRKVTLIAVGSLRDVCAAFNRAPELLREKVERLYICAGNSDGGDEYNVRLDPHAYVGVMRSGLPIYWLPCFGKEPFVSRWEFKQGDLLENCPREVQNYFAYGLMKTDASELAPLDALARAIPEDVRTKVWTMSRPMWSTAAFIAASGRTMTKNAGAWQALPAGVGTEANPVFRFVPAKVLVSDGGVTTSGDITLDVSEPNVHLFRFEGQLADYNVAMKEALGALLEGLSTKRERSLAASELFQEVRRRVGEDADVLAYANVSALADILMAASPAEFGALMRALGLADVKAAGFGFEMRGSAAKHTMFFYTGPQRKGVMRLFAREAPPSKVTDYIPEDTTYFGSAYLGDFAQFWDEGMATLREVMAALGDARGAEQIAAALREWEEKSGLRIGNDILSPFAGELCVAVKVPDVMGVPSIFVLLEVKDAGKATALVEKLMGAVEKAGVRVVRTADEYEGIGITSFLLLPPGEMGAGVGALLAFGRVRPAVAVVGDFLVVGVHSGSVKKVVEAHRGGKSLKDDPGFKTVVANLSEPGRVTGYMDMKEVYDFAYSGFAAFAAMRAGPDLVAKLARIRPYFGSSGGCLYCDEKGITSEKFSESGGAEQILAHVAISSIIPAVIRAKENAQRAMCTNNMRQLAVACIMYANDHDGVLPSKLSDVYPAYVPDLDLFVCPVHKGKKISKERIDAESDYKLLIPGKNLGEIERPAETVMISEKEPNHRGGRNAAYADGHVEWVSEGKGKAQGRSPGGARLIPQGPATSNSREKARHAACLNNVHQPGMACITYAAEHDGVLPGKLSALCPQNKRYAALVSVGRSLAKPRSTQRKGAEELRWHGLPARGRADMGNLPAVPPVLRQAGMPMPPLCALASRREKGPDRDLFIVSG
jgi:prepilin-type processing-associated H-X9-DG protein